MAKTTSPCPPRNVATLLFDAPILEVLVLGEQLEPYFNQLAPNDLHMAVSIFNDYNALNITRANNLFHRSYLLNRDRSLKSEEYADIVDQLLSPGVKASEYQLNGASRVVKESLANEDIPASLLAKIVKVYGKLVHFHDFSDMKLQSQLVMVVKKAIDTMSLSELGCTTTGLSLARIADRTVYWLIEARSREREMLIIYLKASKILNNNNINNKNNNNNNSNDNSSDHLSEVAQGFLAMNMGSASFWRTFRSFSAENLESVSPSQFTERIVILVQKQGLFDKGLAERFETSYLARSSEFNSSDSIGMFSLFAQAGMGSMEFWRKFELEFKGLQENLSLEENGILILSLLNVLPKLSERSVKLMQAFVLAQGQHMDDTLKDELWKKMDQQGFLSPELEAALEKSKYSR